MPNWVHNTLTIEGNPNLVSQLKEQINKPFTVSHENWDLDTQSMKRMDVSYSNPVFAFWNIVKPTDMVEYAKQSNVTDTKLDWFTWNNTNWGSKWDVAVSDGDKYPNTELVADEANGENHVLVYRFDTPWGVPHQVLIKLSEQYPTILFTNKYEEETGWGGEDEYVNGNLIEGVEYNWMCYRCEYMELDDPSVNYNEEQEDYVCPKCQYPLVDLETKGKVEA